MIELSEDLSFYVRRDLKINDDTKTNFTENELANVSCLSISHDDISVIKYFKNLSVLYLDRYPSITSEDIEYIGENIKSIFSIKIKEQNSLYSLDLSNFENLLELALIHNDNLIDIKGIDKVNRLTLYDNKEFKNTQQIVDNLNRHPEGRYTLDFLYYVPIVRLLGRDRVKGFDHVSWVESLGLRYFNVHEFNEDEIRFINDYVSTVIGKYIYTNDSQVDKFGILYKWMISNIKFLNEDEENNAELLKNTNTYHVFADKVGGRLSYAKAFQVLLAYAGVESEMVYSYGALDTIGYINGVKVFSLLGKSDYALLRVKLDNRNYYSDIAWDSLIEKFKYAEALRVFLVSKDELSSRHHFVGEGNVVTSYSYHGDDADDLLMFAKYRLDEVHKVVDKLIDIEYRLKSVEVDKVILGSIVNNNEVNNSFNYAEENIVLEGFLNNEEIRGDNLLGKKKSLVYSNEKELKLNYFGNSNITHDEVIQRLNEKLDKLYISKDIYNILSNL